MFDTIQNICSVIDKGTFFYATTKNWLVSSNFNLRKGSPVELNKLHFLTFIKEDPEFCYLHCFRKLLKIEVDIYSSYLSLFKLLHKSKRVYNF